MTNRLDKKISFTFKFIIVFREHTQQYRAATRKWLSRDMIADLRYQRLLVMGRRLRSLRSPER